MASSCAAQRVGRLRAPSTRCSTAWKASGARPLARRWRRKRPSELRVARELHDEIGQTLTAVTIQAERAAEGDPAFASDALSSGRRRDQGQPGRGAADRARAASRGARRPRSCERPDHPLHARRRARRRSRASGAPGESCRPCRRMSSSSSTASLRRRLPTLCVTPAPTRRPSRSRPMRRRVASRVSRRRAGDAGTAAGGTAGIAGMRERALLVGGRLSIESRPDRAPRCG